VVVKAMICFSVRSIDFKISVTMLLHCIQAFSYGRILTSLFVGYYEGGNIRDI